jgi:two-component system, cell cycle sensor histidine kinase and response regulator CckA
MIREALKVLLVEDNPADVILVREMLRDAGAAHWEITVAGRLAQALELLGTHSYDVALLDLGLPDSRGLAGLDQVAARFPHVPIVIMTGLGDEAMGIEAIRRGAGDYLVKGQADGALIVRAIRYTIERKQAAESLRRSETRYRLLLENMTDLVLTVDADKRLTFVSPSYCEMLGRTEADLLGRNILEFTAEVDGPMVARAEENLRHPPHVFGLEWKVPTPDGGRWVAWLIKSVVDDTGWVKEVIAVGRDVTERRDWEEALRASEERFRIAAGLASDLIFEWDSQNQLVTWFGDVDGVFGYGPGEFPRVLLDEIQLIHPHDLPRATVALENHLAAGEPFNQIYRLRRKDGSYAVISSRGKMLKDIKSDRLRWIGVNSDITAQTQAEEDVSRLNRIYEATVATIPSSILLLDHRLHIIMTNARFRLDHRLDGREMEGKRVEEVLKSESFSDPELIPRILAIAAEGGSYRSLGVNHTSDAHPLMVVDIHVQGIPSPDGNHMVLLVLNDVTEATQLREQLYHSHKLEAIGELAGGIAHDFNNNLIPIMTYSQIMLAGMDPANPMCEDLMEIKKAADRSATLTHQLLAFSHKQKLELTVFDLNQVIADMGKMLNRLLGENIRLETRLDRDLVRIKADRSQLEHVLVNLAINARDAMQSGGKLTISTQTAEVEDALQEQLSLPAGNYLLLTVSDTGAGMDEATRKRIFEPFFTTKEKGKGTGLGLSTVYGIVMQSGGNILVESRPAQGSAFRIYLPLTTEPATPALELAAAAKARPAVILLVEDDTIVRRATARLIRGFGYQVLEAEGGDDALRICGERQWRLDLVISDIIMPDMSGPEFVRRCLAQRPGLKVIYVSGYADHEIINADDLAAAAAFIEKPFSAPVLAAKICEVLG